MENDQFQRKQQDSVYSVKVKAGKRRTYFFDVRKTKGEDFYLTLTESTRRFNDEGYERHKIFFCIKKISIVSWAIWKMSLLTLKQN